MSTQKKAFILLTEEEAMLIQRELIARLTQGGNGLFCKLITDTGYEIYNPNTNKVVFKYVREGRSEYSPKIINAHKFLAP